MSEDGKYIYHIGIIDYLQLYNLWKVGEHFYKNISSDGTKISCVPPIFYSERFFQFMSKELLINQD